jgi:hypothetical protein
MSSTYIWPITRSTITISKINPNPPVGKYPQFRLCGHLGNAPSSAKTRITISIVPSIFSPHITRKPEEGQEWSLAFIVIVSRK